MLKRVYSDTASEIIYQKDRFMGLIKFFRQWHYSMMSVIIMLLEIYLLLPNPL